MIYVLSENLWTFTFSIIYVRAHYLLRFIGHSLTFLTLLPSIRNVQHTKLTSTSIIRISHYHRNYGQTFPTNLYYIHVSPSSYQLTCNKLISNRSSNISIHMHVNLCVVSPILSSDNWYLICVCIIAIYFFWSKSMHWSEHIITCLIEYLHMHTNIYIHTIYIYSVYT